MNGWSSQTFHSYCDGKGPTVTIVSVAGTYIFGGYTDQSCMYDNLTAFFFFFFSVGLDFFV